MLRSDTTNYRRLHVPLVPRTIRQFDAAPPSGMYRLQRYILIGGQVLLLDPHGVPHIGHNSRSMMPAYSDTTVVIFALGILSLVLGVVSFVVSGILVNLVASLGSIILVFMGATLVRQALVRADREKPSVIG